MRFVGSSASGRKRKRPRVRVRRAANSLSGQKTSSIDQQSSLRGAVQSWGHLAWGGEIAGVR